MDVGPTDPGTVLLGKYRVERTLGEGGMATVLEATHISLKQPVALKLLRRDIASNPANVTRFPVRRISGSLVNTMKSAGAVRGLAAKKKQHLSFTPNQIRLVGGVVDPGRPLAFGNLSFSGGGPSWFLSGGDRYASDVDLLLFPHDDKKATAIAKDLRKPNYASVFLPRPNGKLDFEAKATRSKGPTFISTVIVDQR